MTDHPPTASPSQQLAPLLAVNFVGTLGFSIVVPFLVTLVTLWGGNAVVYGLIAATYSAFQLIGAPVLGRLSDRIGRRRVLLISQAGTLASWGLFLVAFVLPDARLLEISSAIFGEFALTLPLIVLFLARAADGLTGGNVSVANAYLADITSEQDRSRNYGRMAMSTNLGFIIGPALAGLLGATVLGEVLPVATAFAISAVALVLIRFGLQEVIPTPVEAPVGTRNACRVYGQEVRPSYKLECDAASQKPTFWHLPNMPALMSVNFLIMMGFSFFYATFPVHAVGALDWDVVEIGTYFAVLSLLMVVVQGPVLSWASDRFSERTLMVYGGLVLAAGFVALTRPELFALYLGAALIALGNGLMWPTFQSALSKSAGPELQGTVQGFAGSAAAVASILGLVLGGLAYVQLGAAIFTVAAATIAAAALVSFAYRKPAHS
ncbi:hypothetical protein ACMU_14150 [Actibacterium mucosum KCTC 23349]|uniref:Major facilitator superfamily (MFS) profile domain-containing protein n=1 Tax=Actibacterium mucosum KCTC 23349 TaxID=1454373 RepID=A0A037ZHB8_9RHOB|nr:MFS transporter [Actibacterium mucosum]KAJ54902.1 hypothetical protein ACMU_14150 [Actibacterium mucosum KCTC 23349]